MGKLKLLLKESYALSSSVVVFVVCDFIDPENNSGKGTGDISIYVLWLTIMLIIILIK